MTKSPLLRVERFITNYERVFSRIFLYGEIIGFGQEKTEDCKDIKEGIYSIGLVTYPAGMNKEFYYSTATNKIIGKKDFIALQDKGDWRVHDLIQIQIPGSADNYLVNWDIHRYNKPSFLIGSIIGVIQGQEQVLQNRINYIQYYPPIYNELKHGSGSIEFVTIKEEAPLL
jgi:hypothetical protein